MRENKRKIGAFKCRERVYCPGGCYITAPKPGVVFLGVVGNWGIDLLETRAKDGGELGQTVDLVFGLNLDNGVPEKFDLVLEPLGLGFGKNFYGKMRKYFFPGVSKV